jgi:GLPGLI family protein
METDMKRIMTMAALILAGLQLTGNAGAQVIINIVDPDEVLKTKPIDDVLFTAQYRMTSVGDTLHPEVKTEEMMMLKTGARSSVFYSYAKFLADSVVEAAKASGASTDALMEQLRAYQSRVNYKVYKNYPAGKVTTLDQIASNRFRCEEVNERPGWELRPDTLTLLSYPCQKAVCRFKGRTWEAWFTPAIPRSEGPWKLHGLPGLILKASDSRGEYLFECTGLIQSRGQESIPYGDTGHEPISRRNLNRQFERYAADPIEYVKASNPNITIRVQNEEGQSIRPRHTPYNPIERTEE